MEPGQNGSLRSWAEFVKWGDGLSLPKPGYQCRNPVAVVFAKALR